MTAAEPPFVSVVRFATRSEQVAYALGWFSAMSAWIPAMSEPELRRLQELVDAASSTFGLGSADG